MRTSYKLLLLHLSNLAVGFIVGLSLERRFAHKELVGEDAQAPQVYLLVVHGTLDHLWWEVVERPAHRCAPAVGRVHRPTEVSNLDVACEHSTIDEVTERKTRMIVEGSRGPFYTIGRFSF